MAEEKKQNWWKRKTPGQKASFIVGAILFVFSLAGFILLMNGRAVFGDEFGDKFFGEGIANGWIIIGNSLIDGGVRWVVSMLIVSIGITLIFIATFITHIFDGKSRKAKTISALLRSLCKYIIIIAMICVILVVWGVDVVGIIAGVGVLTLIVGLGCQSLIQDVISGIFIVFDDYFAVGDTVIIDGFRGTIVDVGLKTTKLQDFGGNIKSITNSSIVTVVNMSRLRSVASVTLSVSYNEDVERVEALIIQEVEALKTKVPNIIDGPWYKGIDNVSASSIDFLVIAFTNEDNRFQVTRDLKREFYLLFKNNNVQIPYPQVTVNPEDSKDRPKATKEEITLALQEQRKLRGLEPINVKKNKGNSVVRRMKKALDKTESEFDGKQRLCLFFLYQKYIAKTPMAWIIVETKTKTWKILCKYKSFFLPTA